MSPTTIIDTVTGLASTFASATGYPSLARRLINYGPFDVSFDVAPTARISRGVQIQAHLTMRELATIESGAVVRGSVRLDRRSRVGPNSVISGDVTLGPWSNFTRLIEAVGEVTVGGFGAFAQRTTFMAHDHETRLPGVQNRMYKELVGDPLPSATEGPIKVGNDVWIGADATVLTGVTIGDGAVIGAGSVVTNDVEPYEIVGGVPAEHIDWRFDEPTRNQLKDIAWWDWDDQRIVENKEFFTTNLSCVDNIEDLIE